MVSEPVVGQRLGRLIGRGARADVYALPDGKVLKLFHEGISPRTAEEEARAASLAHAGGLATPECFGTVMVDGRPGIIFERVDGPSLRDRLLASPRKTRRLAAAAAELHARLHAIHAPSGWPCQRDHLRRRIAAATGLDESTRQVLLGRIEGLPDGDRLCHGDFHPGNILLGPRGPVLIDWQDPTSGNPTADVARTLLLVQNSSAHVPRTVARAAYRLLTAVFVKVYIEAYTRLRPLDPAELRAWRPIIAAARLPEGIEPERELLLRQARDC